MNNEILDLTSKTNTNSPVMEEIITCKKCGKQLKILFKNRRALPSYVQRGYCSSKCYRTSEEFALKQKEGQKKRIEKLKERGTYKDDVVVNGKCIFCGKEYSYVINKNKYQYFANGYCSDECFRKSGKKKILKYKTELSNKGVDVENKTDEEIYEMAKAYMSDRTEKSYEKWYQSFSEKYLSVDPEYFSHRSKKSSDKGKIKFLINNGIIDENEEYTSDIINKLYKHYFNEITKHGEKVKKGRLKKNNNNEIAYHESFKKPLNKRVENFLKHEYGEKYINEISDEEYEELFRQGWQFLIVETKKGKKSPEELKMWKISNIFNNSSTEYSYKEMLLKSPEEIDKIYTEYMSSRIGALNCIIDNGYRKTVKGWFRFTNGKDFFYRSSWELDVCKTLDEMMRDGDVIEVKEPRPIPYLFEGIQRHYFSDFLVVLSNGEEFVYEVKPYRKIKEERNQKKFESAINEWGKHFEILTENEIYGKNLKKILLKNGKRNS